MTSIWIMQCERIEIENGLYLLSSRLGWLLTAPRMHEIGVNDDINMLILTTGSTVTESSLFTDIDKSIPKKPNVEDFWNVESIGITESDRKSYDDIAMSNFKDTIKHVGDRYHVTQPWRDENAERPENRGLAIGRLKSLSNKLTRTPELIGKHDAIFKEQEQKGIIEKIDRDHCEGRKNYILHPASYGIYPT